MKMGDQQVSIKMGFDVEKASQPGKGLTFVIEPGQNLGKDIKVYGKDGKVISLNQRQAPLLLSDVDKVVVNGTEYMVAVDAWNNPALFIEKPPAPVLPEAKKAIEDVSQIWVLATTKPEELQPFLQSTLTGGRHEELMASFEFIKAHPELQKISVFTTVDPWQLVDIPPFVREWALSNLPKELQGTESERLFKSVVRKIADGQELSSEEFVFLNVWTNKRVALTRHVYATEQGKVTGFNEQYVLANLAENYLLKEIPPAEAFAIHRQDFTDFARLMKDRGTDVPPWFDGYTGREFRYGVDLGLVKAVAEGRYYVSHRLESPQQVARILDHERIHAMLMNARIAATNGDLAKLPDVELFNEPLTETLALLIKHKGNVDTAIADNLENPMDYFTAVDELLRMVKETNLHSKDDLLGTELMFKGVLAKANGSKEYSLDLLQEYFDKNVAGQGKSFSERMMLFTNETKNTTPFEVPGVSSTVSLENVKRVISAVTSGRGSVDLSSIRIRWQIQTRRDELLSSPLALIFGEEKPLDNLFLEAISADPQAKKEFQDLVDEGYKGYSKVLQGKVEQISKKQVVPPQPPKGSNPIISAIEDFSTKAKEAISKILIPPIKTDPEKVSKIEYELAFQLNNTPKLQSLLIGEVQEVVEKDGKRRLKPVTEVKTKLLLDEQGNIVSSGGKYEVEVSWGKTSAGKEGKIQVTSISIPKDIAELRKQLKDIHDGVEKDRFIMEFVDQQKAKLSNIPKPAYFNVSFNLMTVLAINGHLGGELNYNKVGLTTFTNRGILINIT